MYHTLFNTIFRPLMKLWRCLWICDLLKKCVFAIHKVSSCVWQHNWLGCAYNQWTTFIYMPAGTIFRSVLFLSTPASSCELEFNVPRIQDGHGWPICSEMSRMWRALKSELGNEVRHSSLAQSENPTVTMTTVVVAYCSQVGAYSIVCVQYK